MPSLPVVPGVIKVQMKWTVGGDSNAENVLHFGYTGGPPNGTNCAAIATGVNTAWASNLKGDAGTFVTLQETTVTDLSSTSGAQGSAASGVAGTSPGGVLPGSACAMMNHAIARRYRGGKPRTYLPPPSDAYLADAQHWTGAWQGSINGNYPAFVAAVVALTGIGCTITGQVNVSYYHGFTNYTKPSGRQASRPTLRGTPLVDAITGSIVNPVVGSQRRRLRGG